MSLTDLLLLLGLLGRLALVELGRHLDQDLGVLGQIIVDDVDDLFLLERLAGSVDQAGGRAPQNGKGGAGDDRGHHGGHERGHKACLEVHAEISGG